MRLIVFQIILMVQCKMKIIIVIITKLLSWQQTNITKINRSNKVLLKLILRKILSQ